jgi:hypothetical protein
MVYEAVNGVLGGHGVLRASPTSPFPKTFIYEIEVIFPIHMDPTCQWETVLSSISSSSRDYSVPLPPLATSHCTDESCDPLLHWRDPWTQPSLFRPAHPCPSPARCATERCCACSPRNPNPRNLFYIRIWQDLYPYSNPNKNMVTTTPRSDSMWIRSVSMPN